MTEQLDQLELSTPTCNPCAATGVDLGTLIFGIELELIAVYPKGMFPEDLSEPVQVAIASLLSKTGIPATGDEDLEDDIVIHVDEDSESYTKWQMQTESNLWLTEAEINASGLDMATFDDRYSADGFEIVSRKLIYGEGPWTGSMRSKGSCRS